MDYLRRFYRKRGEQGKPHGSRSRHLHCRSDQWQSLYQRSRFCSCNRFCLRNYCYRQYHLCLQHRKQPDALCHRDAETGECDQVHQGDPVDRQRQLPGVKDKEKIPRISFPLCSGTFGGQPGSVCRFPGEGHFISLQSHHPQFNRVVVVFCKQHVSFLVSLQINCNFVS